MLPQVKAFSGPLQLEGLRQHCGIFWTTPDKHRFATLYSGFHSLRETFHSQQTLKELPSRSRSGLPPLPDQYTQTGGSANGPRDGKNQRPRGDEKRDQSKRRPLLTSTGPQYLAHRQAQRRCPPTTWQHREGAGPNGNWGLSSPREGGSTELGRGPGWTCGLPPKPLGITLTVMNRCGHFFAL